jgi:beta-fructofuranosidase
MTMPREVKLDGDRLRFQPLAELAEYRGELFETGNLVVDGVRDMEVSGDSYELEVVFEAGDAEEFGLKLRTGGEEETVIAYRPGDKRLCFNRDRSGTGPKGERRTEVALDEEGRLSLRVFVDRSSVEVFAQNGAKVMTGRIYPGPESLGIRVFAAGGSCRIVTFRKWDIQVK